MNRVITFPHMSNYYIPISYLLKKITKCKIIVPPPITKKTLELGSNNSPEYVCVPFKYNLGNFIESLDMGANTIIQAGGGCRYGYYGELQEQILKDMNYEFEFINLIKNNHISIIKLYKYSKKINKKLNIMSYIYYCINTILIMIIMDKFDNYKRKNKGFEIEKGSYKNVETNLLKELLNENLSIIKIIKIYIKYKKTYKKIKINKNKNNLKIGIIGELYSLMEPFSNNNIENKLLNKKIEIERLTTLSYLLLKKKFVIKKHIKKSKKYMKYNLGADASTNIYQAIKFAKKNYDGIIHIKSFGCTPEINAIPILKKISKIYNIPILYLSVDSQDNEVAIDTRIEAFYDMILQKNNKGD